jgi:hypothetical protein
VIYMPVSLHARLAERIVDSAVCRLHPTSGNKILCTKDALKQALLAAVGEAHEIGFLAGQKEQYAELTRSGNPDRPAWMDIRLDDPQDLPKHNIRLRPIVLRSLIGAGCRCLGELCWVPDHELWKLFYVGRATTRQLRNIIRQFQTRPLDGGHDS